MKVQLVFLMSVLAVLAIAGSLSASDGATAEKLAGTPAKKLAGIPAELTGKPLAVALRQLQDQGLDLFFTSQLVPAHLKVVSEPTATNPRDLLDQLLAEHGLVAVDGPGGRLVVVAGEPRPAKVFGQVRERLSQQPIVGVRILLPAANKETLTAIDGVFELADLTTGLHVIEAHLPGFVVERQRVELRNGEQLEVIFDLQSADLSLDEIIVTPSRVSLLMESPATGFDLDRNDILALPHLGDDVFRSFTLLPGVSSEEISARFSVRGSRPDEVLVLLDGVELFEPYHLKDYSGTISIITPRALREVNLITGGFPAQYGDRMSGVLDMSSNSVRQNKIHFGLGLLSAEVAGSGTFAKESGTWIASLRRGNLDLALDLVGTREKPQYWDAFGKLEYQLSPQQSVGAHLLYSDDKLTFNVVEPDVEELYTTSYNNTYSWLTYQSIFSSRLFANTVGAVGRVERNRRGIEVSQEPDELQDFSIFDRRSLDVLSLKQNWNFEASQRHYLKWGFEARQLESDYDYRNQREFEDDDPLEDIRSEPRTGTTNLKLRLRGQQTSAYVSDRIKPSDKVTVELGIRWDRQTLTADNHLSPRFNLVLSPATNHVFRLAWGYFYQTQRPYELQVEDGISNLSLAERTEQRVLGYEHAFTVGKTDWQIRIEAYQNRVTNPRARYENLYEPISIYPEIEADRVLIAPRASEAYGAEIFLRGHRGRADWWGSYTYARTLDRIAGTDIGSIDIGSVDIPRRIDQPHSVKLDFNYRTKRDWNINLAWRYHTGWPITPVTARLEVDDEGEEEEVLSFGRRNSKRLPEYHRLDLRASREWHKKTGILGFFLEVQNLYDRKNIAGWDVEFETLERPDGLLEVIPEEEIWGGILPSFGITWDF